MQLVNWHITVGELILNIGKLTWYCTLENFLSELTYSQNNRLKSKVIQCWSNVSWENAACEREMIFLVLFGSSELKFQLAYHMHCQIYKCYCDHTNKQMIFQPYIIFKKILIKIIIILHVTWTSPALANGFTALICTDSRQWWFEFA